MELENQNTDQNKQVEDKPIEQPNPVEQQAREHGWVPKEEFQGEEHRWVDAAEFLRRGELFSKIEDQNKTIRQLQKTLTEFRKHHENVREAEYKRALDELKRQKKEALIEGDADTLLEIDEKIDLVKQEQQTLKAELKAPIEDVPVVNPVFEAWKERNSWYESSRAMRSFADDLGTDLARQGFSPEEVLKKVEAEVKKEFAHKFTNPNREKPGNSLSPGGGKSRSDSDFTMSEDEIKIMNTFIRSGVITKEQYIKDLKLQKGLK